MAEQRISGSILRGPVVTVASAVLLLLLHAGAGFFVLGALLTESEGSWDRTVTDTARLWAVLGLAVELPAVAVTAACVAVGRLRRWWYAPAAALVLTALARMVFAPRP
ncbi:hypothetical protein [Streptomyces virginiae]|uniref:Uncharacterized protein n=1 Tax=Streptomyces virginiae TaxID=1961 RepID=A0ABZ1T8L7_STRVG|nr:hypothetical protein [Streptomyces virginiae]WTB21882.1 hypothetical protein OG253_10460 [Streptomyces virginiae]